MKSVGHGRCNTILELHVGPEVKVIVGSPLREKEFLLPPGHRIEVLEVYEGAKAVAAGVRGDGVVERFNRYVVARVVNPGE